MLHKPNKRGRPQGPRLDQADADFFKELIRQQGWPTRKSFYYQVFEETQESKYKGFKKPKEPVTVKSAFQAWVSGDRSLPHLYEMILDDLLGRSWRDDFPSRRNTEIPKAAQPPSAPLPLPLGIPLTAPPTPVPGGANCKLRIHAKVFPDGAIDVSCYDLATDLWEDYIHAREQARDVKSSERDHNRNLRNAMLALFGHFDGVVCRITDELEWMTRSTSGKPGAQPKLSDKIDFLEVRAAAGLGHPIQKLDCKKAQRLRAWINHPGIRRYDETTGKAITSDLLYSHLTFERLREIETELITWLKTICSACDRRRLVDTKRILEKFGAETGNTSGIWREF